MSSIKNEMFGEENQRIVSHQDESKYISFDADGIPSLSRNESQ